MNQPKEARLILRNAEPAEKISDGHVYCGWRSTTASKYKNAEVQKHEFLTKESLQEICLKELVLVARVSAINDWEIYTDEKIEQEDAADRQYTFE